MNKIETGKLIEVKKIGKTWIHQDNGDTFLLTNGEIIWTVDKKYFENNYIKINSNSEVFGPINAVDVLEENIKGIDGFLGDVTDAEKITELHNRKNNFQSVINLIKTNFGL